MANPSLKRVELWIRRVFLRILARYGTAKRRNLTDIKIGNAPSILLLRQDRLGDVLMSTFVLVALRNRFPQSRIAILLGKNNREVIPLLPVECDTFIYQKRFFADWAMVRKIRKQKFDIAIDLTDKASVTSSIMLTSIAAKLNIGVEKENSVVYDITVPRPSQMETHIADRVSELLRPLGIDPASLDKKPRLKLDIKQLKGRVGLNVSSRTADRSAPPAACAEIANGVLKMGFPEVIVFAAPHERTRGEETVRLANDSRVHLSPKVPTFIAFAEQVTTCEYLITVDTSIIQIAAATGIPMVLMFKPMFDEHPWTPVGVPFEFYTQYPALSALEPQPVLALFRKLLERTQEQVLGNAVLSH